MSRTSFIIVFVLATIVSSAQDKWSLKITFTKQEAPGGIINSSFQIDPYAAINKKGTACAFLLETFGSMYGSMANKAVSVSSSGKKLAEAENLLPLSVQIKQIMPDAVGNFWLSVMEGEREENQIPHAAIYCFDSLLHQKYSLSLDSVFYPIALMEKSVGKMYISFKCFNQLSLFGNSYKDFKEESLQLMLVDFRSKKIIERQQLESTGDILNDPAFFSMNKDSSFYLIQNTVILRGPDHHDIHLYSFSKTGNLLNHRQLKGIGELTHLWGQQVSSANNQLTIDGFADDLINFEKANLFFKERSKQRKAGSASNSDADFSPFLFHVTYDQKLKMLNYNFSEAPDTFSSSPSFEGIVRSGKFEIKYRSTPGTENTSEPPVFEFYKD